MMSSPMKMGSMTGMNYQYPIYWRADILGPCCYQGEWTSRLYDRHSAKIGLKAEPCTERALLAPSMVRMRRAGSPAIWLSSSSMVYAWAFMGLKYGLRWYVEPLALISRE